MTISRDEMMPALIQACPSFGASYKDFLEDWKDEACPLPHYIALSDFARHLIEMLERNDMQSFPQIFQEVDRLEKEGDSYVSEAIVVGLLEDLQNTNLHTERTTPENFRPFLLPNSEKWWDKIYRFWEHGEIIAEDTK